MLTRSELRSTEFGNKLIAQGRRLRQFQNCLFASLSPKASAELRNSWKKESAQARHSHQLPELEIGLRPVAKSSIHSPPPRLDPELQRMNGFNRTDFTHPALVAWSWRHQKLMGSRAKSNCTSPRRVSRMKHGGEVLKYRLGY